MYFSNCLQYPSVAKLIFNQSLLCNALLTAYVMNMRLLNHYCDLSMSTKHKHYYFQPRLSSLVVLGLQLLRNIHLWNEYHWSALFNKKNGLYFEAFVEYQLLHGFYLHAENSGGSNAMQCILSLIVYGAHYLRNCRCDTSEPNYNFTKLMQWFGKIKRMSINEKSQRMKMKQALVCLRNKEYLDRMYYIHQDLAEHVWREKWMDMGCARVGCKVKRKDSDHLYKCKKCRVVRYCSKRCQKIDWKKNHHAMYCGRFRKMRKDRSRYLDVIKNAK